MGLLYNIAKWSVNKLIKKGVDLTDLVETDGLTKKVREAANILNNQLITLQDQFALKRAEIIELQNDLIQTVEPTFIRLFFSFVTKKYMHCFPENFFKSSLFVND